MSKWENVFSFKAVIGVVIILFGVTALLNNLGLDIDVNIWKIWPVIFIFAGFSHYVSSGKKQLFGAVLLGAVGILLLLNNYDVLNISFRDMWPFILILVGGAILKQSFFGKGKGDVNESTINISAILGGGEFKYTSKDLSTGTITAFMGGCTLDLRESEIGGDTLVIDTFALWGGIEIRVPAHWVVSMEGIPLLGGMSSKTVHTGDIKGAEPVKHTTGKKLIVKGMAIMGGVEVTN